MRSDLAVSSVGLPALPFPDRVVSSLSGGTAFLAVGAFLSLLFRAGFLLPAAASAIVLSVAAAWGLFGRWSDGASLLPRFMLLLYILPFSALIAFVIVRDVVWWDTEAASGLVLDPRVTADMAMVGLVGVCGLLAGFRFGEWPSTPRRSPIEWERPLGVGVFTLLLAGAGALSWWTARGAASRTSYFTDALEAATAGDAGSSLYLVSYTLIVVLLLDAMREHRSLHRRFKLGALLAVCTYVVVVLQLLRGDRESLGLVVALGALHVTGRADNEPVTVSLVAGRIRRLLPIVLLVLVTFLAVGQLRYGERVEATGVVVGAVAREVLAGGTWTAVLLGNLGLSGEHVSGEMRFLEGKTYVDYALSMPPGIVSRAVGLRRPLESENGPGLWYYPLQLGGVHPVVVPFKNFGIFGALFVMMIIGWLIARREYWNRLGTFWSRLMYGTFFVGSFSWFWYGDMPFIRCLMAAAMVGALYRGLSLLAPERGTGSATLASQGL